MKRGTTTNKDCWMLTVWVPVELREALDQALIREDTDRSKFVRNAIRERIEAVTRRGTMTTAAN